MTRAQSDVVGAAILIGLTVLAVGTLTASIGTVVDGGAASADATRVANTFDSSLDPADASGVERTTVSFTGGELAVEERTLRVLTDSGVVATVEVDALVFTAGDHRVEYVAGAIVEGSPDRARLSSSPPIATATEPEGVLVVGAPKLNATQGTVGSGATDVTLRTEVSHERSELGTDTYRLAIETPTPDPWIGHFESQNATIEEDARSFEGDEHPSVVARYPDDREGYLVVHDMRLEVLSRG